jgi:hypothetical protein
MLRTDCACPPCSALVVPEDHAGHQAAGVGIAVMEDGGSAHLRRITRFVGMQRSITPEQVEIAWYQLQALWPEQSEAYRAGNQFATQLVL